MQGVRVLPESSKAGAHKVKVVGLVVGEVPGSHLVGVESHLLKV